MRTGVIHTSAAHFKWDSPSIVARHARPCDLMFVGGPQRGLFLGCLGVGFACLLVLDLYLAPAALSDDEPHGKAPEPASAATDPRGAPPPLPPEPEIAAPAPAPVIVPAAARVPTIVARFGLELKETIDESAIHALGAAMIEDHSARVVLEGHSDMQGGKDYNRDLSLERATYVKARLVELGVSPDRIETVGFGATHPLTDDGDAQAENRRVEVRWIGPSPSPGSER
jgi:hypothetical protein